MISICNMRTFLIFLLAILFLFLGSLPAIFIMETIMEHVAKSIAKDSTDNRLMNMYTQGAVSSL